MADDDNPLSPEEIAQLRSLLPYAAEVRDMMEYRAAQRLVLRTWRGLVLGIAGIIAAGLVIKANLKTVLHWVMQ